MELVLVRHTSVEVPAGVCYGQTDVGLKATFPQEAQAVAASLPAGAFGAVYTSPLSRCTRLADRCGYPHARRDDRLMELDFGAWEMQRWDRIADPRIHAWFADWVHTRATGGESFMDMYARVCSFLSGLQRTGLRRALVFGHGGVIACAKVFTEGVPFEEAFSHPAAYGSVVILQVTDPC